MAPGYTNQYDAATQGLTLPRTTGTCQLSYAYDATGKDCVVAVTADASHKAAWYIYDASGLPTTSFPRKTADFHCPLSATAMNQESGLYYYGRRFLTTSQGRWCSRDPIEELGGDNLFSFVDNSAVNQYDPHGQIAGVDDAAVLAAAYAALATAAGYLMTQDGQEQCKLIADGIAGGCACACDALMSASKDAYQKAQKQLEVALTHLTYLAGSGHGKDPNDRWRDWNHWKSEIRTALRNDRNRAKDCTTKAKDEILKQIQKIEEQLKQIDALPRGGM